MENRKISGYITFCRYEVLRVLLQPIRRIFAPEPGCTLHIGTGLWGLSDGKITKTAVIINNILKVGIVSNLREFLWRFHIFLHDSSVRL